MYKMMEHSLNKFDNFIHAVYFDDLSICDKIIDYHSIGEQIDGISGISSDGSIKIDKNIKNSKDVILDSNTELYVEYFKQLYPCMHHYTSKYSYSDSYDPWAVTEATNIQKYEPAGGFYKWHTERTGCKSPVGTRHLVFMTYLNNVTDDGETEFYYQKLKVKPEKGLTLIWPADWTFTHRGIPSMTQTKYIVTGWYNYIPTNM